MSARDDLDPEDRAKIETWRDVMTLLRHYRDLTFLPLYQLSTGLLGSSREHKDMRERKIAQIVHYDKKLDAKWESVLGPNWRQVLDPED
jgi:hypothetical protein